MNQQEHQEAILHQYASDSGIAFYQQVMGDGDLIIHYGIYKTPEDSMTTAIKRATLTLLEQAQKHLKEKPKTILDLGSGLGGGAHLLAQQTKAQIHCVDLSSRFNDQNESKAKELNLQQQITTHTKAFENLPSDWSGAFDLIWSQEALCHAYNRKAVFEEIYRCLKPNGVFAFSDIMLASEISQKQASVYASVNSISSWSNLKKTQQLLKEIGFKNMVHLDWSEQLQRNFEEMLKQIKQHKQAMLKAKVERDFIENFEHSLQKRLKWKQGEVLCWNALIVKK